MHPLELLYRQYCFRQALKVGLASVLCVLIIAIFNIPDAYMTLMPICVLSTMYTPQFFRKGFHRFTCAVVGSLLGFAVLMVFHSFCSATLVLSSLSWLAVLCVLGELMTGLLQSLDPSESTILLLTVSLLMEPCHGQINLCR
jgi:uncharacterized membrane protein YccC